MEQKSGDGATGKQPAESPLKSKSNEAEKSERDIESPTASSDKRKLESKVQKCATSTAVDESEVTVALSPTKRKCPERHLVASGKIEPGGKQLKADSPKPETSATGSEKQESPKRSPTAPGTSAAGVVTPGSPKRSPTIHDSSAAGVIMQGSPIRSPTKRTYKEIQQSHLSVDELVKKRPKEESGYQSDSALDLRKDFKKQMPSSKQSPEHDCQPTSSDKMRELVEKQSDETCATQRNFPRDPKSESSEVTSSDWGEADESSTSNESVESSIGEVASGAQGYQVQNVAEANKESPRTSPQHSGARPKETAGGSRSADCVVVSYPRFSPSRRFYGEPTIRRISPQRAAPSCSSDGVFKVPPPPPPLEESDKPARITNMLEMLNSFIETTHAVGSAEDAFKETMKELEQKARREQEQAENFAKAQKQAKETTKKLKEKEARLKGENKSAGAENKSDIAPDDSVAGSSTSRDEMTECRPEGNLEVKASVDKPVTPPSKKENKITKSTPEREDLSAAKLSMCDENANKMEGLPSLSACKDNANESQTCTVQTNREETEDDARTIAVGVAAQRPHEVPRNQEQVSFAESEDLSAAKLSICDENANKMEGLPSPSACKDDNANESQTCTVQTNREETDDAGPIAGGVAAQRPHEVPRNQEQVSLQQLVPQVDEISLYDSLENVAVADSEEDDNVD